MYRPKEVLLEETYQKFMRVGLGQYSPDVLSEISDERIMGFGTTVDEKVFYISGLRELLIRQKEQSEGMSLTWEIIPLHRHISADANTAIFADDLLLHITVGADTVEMYLRFSVILEYKADKWLVVHWHGSKPENVQSEKDTYGIESWKKRAEALEKLVEERTADLVVKNRELEVEVALERVRARSMAMHKSEELNEVIKVVYDQFTLLNIHVEHAGFIIDYKEKEDMHIWLADMHTIPFQVTLPYFDCAHWNSFNQAKKSSLDFFSNHLSFDEKNKFYKDLFEFVPGVPEETLEYYLSCPGLAISTVLLENIGLYIENFDGIPFTDDENKALMRFGKVFQQTYTRFLDLQKAEAQARESQIEAALEKVRSRSLAMHRAVELGEVVTVVVEKLRELHIPVDDGVALVTFVEGSKDLIEWMENPGFPSAIKFYQPYFDHPVLSDFWKAKNGGLDFIAPRYNAEENRSFLEHIFEYGDYKNTLQEVKDYCLAAITYSYSVAFQKNSSIFINDYSGRPLSDAEIDILKRFSKVFEQAYIRFLDLQNAEAQAREARIEAALERVRSRTMAMQSSAELGAVAAELFAQMNQLVTNLWTCGFVLCEKFRDEDEWWLSMDGDFTRGFFLPNVGDYAHATLFEGWLKGEALRAVQLDGVALQQHYDWLMEIPVSRAIFEEMDAAGLARPDWQKLHAAYFSKGYLVLITREPCREEEIFKRFAQVFDQTYTRFLDLQKAEAQAREAQIEAALERVRAVAMSMMKSDDLLTICQSVFTQLQVLGFENIRAAQIYIRNDEEEKFLNYDYSVVTGSVKVEVNYNSHSNTRRIYDVIRNAGDDLVYNVIEKEKLDEWKSYLYNTLGQQPEESLDTADGLHYYLYSFGIGAFGICTFKAISSEELDILKRFRNVFNLSYQRYADIALAEAQLREARIEASLERVRARTMAMQRSEELLDVASVLFQQVKALGVPQWNCGFNIWEIGDKEFIYYPGTPDGIISQSPCKIPLTEHPVFQQFDASRKRGDELLIYEKEGEMQRDHYRYMLSLPGVGDLLKSMLHAGFEFPAFQIDHVANFAFGNLIFITYEHFPEMHDVFKRFARVFEQTYTRFLDLQKAEAQAKDAIKRASVDRVRAEIASMRTTGDLERIQPLIWNEFKILGVPFIRCGVFIMDEEKQEVNTLLSTPDGQAIAAFRLPFYSTHQSTQIVTHWQQKQLFKDHMDEAAFTEYTQNLVQQGIVPGDEIYVTDNRPKDLYLHFLPFLQGMLYVGNDAPLNDDELQLVQNLADAFSTAYARYEDFNKLDLAKKAVESAMRELKATQSQLVQQEKLASLGQLTAGIAHEIKNPLNFVNNFSEVSIELLDEVLEEIQKNQDTRDETLISDILKDIRSNVQKVHDHGFRANSIVTSMLQHSRGGTGKMHPTDLNALIKEYVNLSYHGMRASKTPIDVDIILDLYPALGMVSLIREDFTRVVINLSNNAFDAMREKIKNKYEVRGMKDEVENTKYELQGTKYEAGEEYRVDYKPTLSIQTRLESGKVLIQFGDNGPGIPDEIKDKILQPFFTTKKGTEGTGLGLSITNDIVKAHGGELKVETKRARAGSDGEGDGSTFIISLPQ